MIRADALVVGAGHNGLVAAILLARAGRRVVVLERSAEPGGAIRTAEVTLPGFHHDLYATNLNLFMGSRFFAELGGELVEHGFEMARADRPFGSAFPDGEFVGVSTDAETTDASIRSRSTHDADEWKRLTARFERIAPHLFPLLGAPMPSAALVRSLLTGRRALGRQWPYELARLTAQSTRELTETHFESREVQALVAAWGMHLDFPPDAPGGALFAFLESFASAAHGMTLGRGGARSLVDSLVSLLRHYGGELICNAEVARIRVRGGRATGVQVSDGTSYEAPTVIGNLTPTGLAALVDPGLLGPAVKHYRYAPGTLMVHLALDEPAPWLAGDAVSEHAYVHIGPYLEDMSLAYTRAAGGYLPERPTLVVGQPTSVDPTRAPEGKHILWIQARVVPGTIRADAADEIDARSWDSAKEPFADRVVSLVEELAPGLRDNILGRFVISPADLERANPNLVGGDHLAGSMHPAQFFFLRPLAGWSRYRTPVEGLYLCGAATWPGAGVGAGSGYLLAKSLLQKRRRPAFSHVVGRAV